MSLTADEQRELLEKTRRIHHELTHEFHSRYVGPDGQRSAFRDTLVGYVLEIDRKLEDVHANMLTTMWRKLKTLGGSND